MRFFVLISGLPASGKSTLGRELAAALGLPLIDKDEILESLFDSMRGDRRTLSRESDVLFARAAAQSTGAILVSHWHTPEMPGNSGTPLPSVQPLINVHCVCDWRIAAERFLQRERHSGHRDRDRSRDEVIESIRRNAQTSDLGIRPRIEVDTSREWNIEEIAAEIRGYML